MKRYIRSNVVTSDVAYHCAKNILDRYSIIKNGFRGNSIYFSESFVDAVGYGAFGIRVFNLDSLNLYIMDSNVDFNQDFSSYDGIKYRYSVAHDWNYEIYNMSKLNSLKRESGYLYSWDWTPVNTSYRGMDVVLEDELFNLKPRRECRFYADYSLFNDAAVPGCAAYCNLYHLDDDSFRLELREEFLFRDKATYVDATMDELRGHLFHN